MTRLMNGACRATRFVLVAIGAWVVGSNTHAATIHVPGQFPTIQAGVDAASIGDTVVVAHGVYTGPGNANILIWKNLTLRSASGIASLCTIDVQGLGRGIRVAGSTTMNQCIIEGLTITGGVLSAESTAVITQVEQLMAQGEDSFGGAGIELYSPATIRSCVLSNNQAPQGLGGGLYIGPQAQGRVDNCDFIGNVAGAGGGVFCISILESRVRNCNIENNHGRWSGGGVMCWSPGSGGFASRLALIQCKINNNTAGPSPFGTDPPSGMESSFGAGLYARERVIVKAVNCRIQGNQLIAAPNWSAHGCGVAMHGIASIPALAVECELVNCIITHNGDDDFTNPDLSNSGGGVFNSGGTLRIHNSTIAYNRTVGDQGGGGGLRHQCNSQSSTTIANTIFWQNTMAGGYPQQISLFMDWPCNTTTITIRHCLVQGGLAGIAGPDVPDVYANNFDVDPRFVDAANGDFALKFASACLNNGDAALLPADEFDLDDDGDISEPIPVDFAERPRQHNPTQCVDLGPLENQIDATCIGDIIGSDRGGPDCIVDVRDLLAIVDQWGIIAGIADVAPAPCGDMIINTNDLLVLFAEWGACAGCN